MEEKHLTFMANKQTRDISLAIFFFSSALSEFAARKFLNLDIFSNEYFWIMFEIKIMFLP